MTKASVFRRLKQTDRRTKQLTGDTDQDSFSLGLLLTPKPWSWWQLSICNQA